MDTETQLRWELQRQRGRIEDALADARVWRANFEAAMQMLAMCAPPDLVELFDEACMREFLDER